MKTKSFSSQAVLISAAFIFLAGTIFVPKAIAQTHTFKRPTGNGEIHFKTNLGSFKILSINNEPVTGTLTFSFHGSVLISGATIPPKITGKVRLEYQNVDHKKLGYHGDGTITVKGPFQSVEWFGSDMTGSFVGRGKVRLSGEFDKNLSTGTYWTTNPKDYKYWPANSVSDIFVPPFINPGNVANSSEKPMSRQQYQKQHKTGGK